MQFQKLSDCVKYYQKYHLTKHKYEWRAKHLKWFDALAIDEIRKYHIKEYHLIRLDEGVSNATINREISFARGAINRVNIDYESTLYNAFDNIRFVEKDFIPNFLTINQYKALLAQCLKMGYFDLHDFLVLLTMTGCRPNEIYSLSWDNVYLDKRLFIVRNCWSKSKKTLYKYLNDSAMAIFQSRYQSKNGPWVFTNLKTNNHIDSYYKVFCKVRKELDFHCTFYDLRHTYASWLVQNSVAIFTVKELLGHSDIGSTMRYAHLDYASKCEALKVIG